LDLFKEIEVSFGVNISQDFIGHTCSSLSF